MSKRGRTNSDDIMMEDESASFSIADEIANSEEYRFKVAKFPDALKSVTRRAVDIAYIDGLRCNVAMYSLIDGLAYLRAAKVLHRLPSSSSLLKPIDCYISWAPVNETAISFVHPNVVQDLFFRAFYKKLKPPPDHVPVVVIMYDVVTNDCDEITTTLAAYMLDAVLQAWRMNLIFDRKVNFCVYGNKGVLLDTVGSSIYEEVIINNSAPVKCGNKRARMPAQVTLKLEELDTLLDNLCIREWKFSTSNRVSVLLELMAQLISRVSDMYSDDHRTVEIALRDLVDSLQATTIESDAELEVEKTINILREGDDGYEESKN